MCAIPSTRMQNRVRGRKELEVGEAYPVALRGCLRAVRVRRRRRPPSTAIHLRRPNCRPCEHQTRCAAGRAKEGGDKFIASSRRASGRRQKKAPAPLKAPRALRCSWGARAVQPPLMDARLCNRELCQRTGLGSVSYWVGRCGIGRPFVGIGIAAMAMAVAVALDPGKRDCSVVCSLQSTLLVGALVADHRGGIIKPSVHLQTAPFANLY
jgi:hypothetical protein